MPTQSFYVSSTPPVKAYALAPYHPYTVKNGGGRCRNPKFDRVSGLILDLKKESERGHEAAIKYWAAHLAFFLRKDIAFDQAEIIIVPSSTKGNINPGLDKIVKTVCKQDKRLSYNRNSLFRTKSINKLSTGGDRSLDVLLNSMDYKGVNGSPATKFILDDVTTTGNSLNASITLINQYMPGLTFVPIVLGKTADDSI
jgi:hypothetical protein